MELPTKIKMYGCTERKSESADSPRQSTIIPFQLLPKLAILLVSFLPLFMELSRRMKIIRQMNLLLPLKSQGVMCQALALNSGIFPRNDW